MVAPHPHSPAGAKAAHDSGSNNDFNDTSTPDDQPSFISDQDALEEIVPDEDHMMEDASDDENEPTSSSTAYRGEGSGERIEIELQNDSIRYFDHHTDSIFAIARHPIVDGIVATGGGDDVGYIWSAAATAPTSTSTTERPSQTILYKMTGHSDSISAITFTTSGEFLITTGLDGRITIHQCTDYTTTATLWTSLASVQEVEEINWVVPHPVASSNGFAVGANDGSVWVYTIDPSQKGAELVISHVFYNHTSSCTAGTFTNDGGLMVTVAEDSSFFVHDLQTGEVKVGFGAEDLRFVVEGGLNAVAVNPAGTIAVVGGVTGACRVVGLPMSSISVTTTTGGGGRRAGGARQSNAISGASGQQAGQLLATLATQSESIESLTFSPTLPLLASGSVDGSIVLYETARWGVRRTIMGHEDAVVKVEFGSGQGGWELTSCSTDGTVRRWDGRTGEAKGVWKGHSEGVLGFVTLGDGTVVTAGDDGVALVFHS